MNNQEVLKTIHTLEQHSIMDIQDTLAELEFGNIIEAKELPAEFGQIVYVKNEEGREFYIGLGGFGFVEIIREGSLDGKIVLAYTE